MLLELRPSLPFSLDSSSPKRQCRSPSHGGRKDSGVPLPQLVYKTPIYLSSILFKPFVHTLLKAFPIRISRRRGLCRTFYRANWLSRKYITCCWKVSLQLVDRESERTSCCFPSFVPSHALPVRDPRNLSGRVKLGLAPLLSSFSSSQLALVASTTSPCRKLR